MKFIDPSIIDRITAQNISGCARLCVVLVAVFTLLLPTVSNAQQYYDPNSLRKTIDRKPIEFLPVGLRLGSFMLGTGIELVAEHKDNIFYSKKQKIDDTIFHVRPWVNLQSDWNRHELNLSFFLDVGRYNQYGSQDYEDWTLKLDGRIDVKRRSKFKYGLFSSQLHEDRSTPDNINGIKPTVFSWDGFDLGYSHTFNRLTAAIRYNRDDTDYENNISLVGGIVDNGDRDRSRDEFVIRLDYELSGSRRMFLQGAGNNVDYDQRVDYEGYERSSEGYNLRAGMTWDLTGVVVGDLWLEYLDQEYDDPRFNNVDGFGIGASLLWTPTDITNVSIIAKNGPQETTQIGASGFYSSLYSVRLQHDLRRNWLFNARASYTDNEYSLTDDSQASLTDTQVFRADLGLIYLINRNFYISGGYVFEKQNANISRFNYKTNRLFLTFGAEL